MLSIVGSMGPTSPNSSDSETKAHAAKPPLPDVPPTAPVPAPVTTPAPAPMSIKDKPSDMGIKPITHKETWTDDKKNINACLCQAPYWPGATKELVTMDANAAASM